MKAVIAGNYKQYMDYLQENNLTPREAKYISSPEMLHGLKNVELIPWGEYWLNPCSEHFDCEEILRRKTQKQSSRQGIENGRLYTRKKS